MSYISAEDILPKELIETIQQYISGTKKEFRLKNLQKSIRSP